MTVTRAAVFQLSGFRGVDLCTSVDDESRIVMTATLNDHGEQH